MKVVLCGLAMFMSLACSDAQTAPAGPAASATQPQAPQSESAVIAEVSGRKITLKELDDRWQSIDPGERARVDQMLYQNRRAILDQMVADVLLEEAAKAAAAPVEQYTDQEINKRLKPITDDDVKRFFETNKERAPGRTLEQLQGPIREYLTTQRQQQARAQLVEDLKKKSPAIRLMLEPPRQKVDVLADDPVVGPATAPVTIVEYSDYQ